MAIGGSTLKERPVEAHLFRVIISALTVFRLRAARKDDGDRLLAG